MKRHIASKHLAPTVPLPRWKSGRFKRIKKGPKVKRPPRRARFLSGPTVHLLFKSRPPSPLPKSPKPKVSPVRARTPEDSPPQRRSRTPSPAFSAKNLNLEGFKKFKAYAGVGEKMSARQSARQSPRSSSPPRKASSERGTRRSDASGSSKRQPGQHTPRVFTYAGVCEPTAVVRPPGRAASYARLHEGGVDKGCCYYVCGVPPANKPEIEIPGDGAQVRVINTDPRPKKTRGHGWSHSLGENWDE